MSSAPSALSRPGARSGPRRPRLARAPASARVRSPALRSCRRSRARSRVSAAADSAARPSAAVRSALKRSELARAVPPAADSSVASASRRAAAAPPACLPCFRQGRRISPDVPRPPPAAPDPLERVQIAPEAARPPRRAREAATSTEDAAWPRSASVRVASSSIRRPGGDGRSAPPLLAAEQRLRLGAAALTLRPQQPPALGVELHVLARHRGQRSISSSWKRRNSARLGPPSIAAQRLDASRPRRDKGA